jgi:hypothetical protein
MARSTTGESCYIFSMKRAKHRRAGATETFSVSVDPETKKALRNLADADYGGNLSALVTDLAEEARRRMAAGAYLRRHAIPPLNRSGMAAVEASIERDVASARRRLRGRRVA